MRNGKKPTRKQKIRLGKAGLAPENWLVVKQKVNGELTFDPDDLEELKEILRTDENAVLLNGYYCNLGPIDEMTREALASALRWQYEEQFSRLADTIEQEDAVA